MAGDSAYIDIVEAFGIRLIVETDPENPSNELRCGRVEVQYKGGNPEYFNSPDGYSEGIWGTVCNDGFDDAEAEVICRQMGIRGASRAISKPLYEQNRDGYIYDASYAKVEDMWKVRKCDICEAGEGPIFFTKTQCQGNEARLWDCPFKNTEDQYCGRFENAGVCCGGELEDVERDYVGDMPLPLFIILLLGLLFVLVLFGIWACRRKSQREADDDIEQWEETDEYGYPIYNFKVNRPASSLPRALKPEEAVAWEEIPGERFIEDPAYTQSTLPRQGVPISSVAAAVRLVLRLNFRAVGDEGSVQRERFSEQLLHDLSQASGLPASSFLVKKLSSGSVVVDCEIYPDHDNPMSPDPTSAARILEAQVHEPDSRLRAGSLTTFISSLKISHPPGDGQIDFNSNFQPRPNAAAFPTADVSNRESAPVEEYGNFNSRYPPLKLIHNQNPPLERNSYHEGSRELQNQWAAPPQQQHWPQHQFSMEPPEQNPRNGGLEFQNQWAAPHQQQHWPQHQFLMEPPEQNPRNGGLEFQNQWAAPHQQHWPPPPRDVMPSQPDPEAAPQLQLHGWVPLENAFDVSNYELQQRQLQEQSQMMDGVAEASNYDVAPWQQWMPTADAPLEPAMPGMFDAQYNGVGPLLPATIDFSQYQEDRPQREERPSRPPHSSRRGRDIQRSAAPRRSKRENGSIGQGGDIWGNGEWVRAQESEKQELHRERGRRQASGDDERRHSHRRHRHEGAKHRKATWGIRDLFRSTSAENRKGGRDKERKEGKGTSSRTRRHRHESKQGRLESEEREDMYGDGDTYDDGDIGLLRVPPAQAQLEEQQQQALRARMHHFKEEAEANKLQGHWKDAQILPTPSLLPAPSHRPALDTPQVFSHPVHSTLEEIREKPRLAKPEFRPASMHAHDMHAPAAPAVPLPYDASLPPMALAQETQQSKVIENGLPRLRYR